MMRLLGLPMDLRTSLLLHLAIPLAILASPAGAQGTFYIEGCSLGCSSAAGGAQVFCSVGDVFVNADIQVRFSEPVLLSSVSPASLQIVNVANGTTPSGNFLIDPFDLQTVLYRPSLSFDPQGNPVFGFDAGAVYQITIPGVAQGDSGPFITSTSLAPNQSRLSCTVHASQGVLGSILAYCSTSANSVGPGSLMGWSGSPSIAANDLILLTAGGPPGQPALFYFGSTPLEIPFGSGFRCVGGSVHRLQPLVAFGAANGTVARPVDWNNLPTTAGTPVPGATRFFQCWYRDPAGGGSGFNLSDGLSVTFVP